jgi:5'-3' exonuclease
LILTLQEQGERINKVKYQNEVIKQLRQQVSELTGELQYLAAQLYKESGRDYEAEKTRLRDAVQAKDADAGTS